MKNKKGNILNFIIFMVVSIILLIIVYFYMNRNREISFFITSNNIAVRKGENTKILYEADSDVTITWESSDSNVLTVDNNGNLYAKDLGTAKITGTAIRKDKEKQEICYVEVYQGNKANILESVNLPLGEIVITKDHEYVLPITYTPNDPYIKSIEYNISNPIITIQDNVIRALDIGVTDLTITINGSVAKTIRVNVIENIIETQFIQLIKDVSLSNEKMEVEVGEDKKIEYVINPLEGYINNIKWESSDPNVVLVSDDGTIHGKSAGNAIVTLTINDNFIESNKFTFSIDVSVVIPISSIKLIGSAKRILKIGDKDKIYIDVLPVDATDKKLVYTSNKEDVVSVSDDGTVYAKKTGSAKITIKTKDEKYKLVKEFYVNPRLGILDGDGKIFKYSANDIKTPSRADESFFLSLVNKGKGSVSNGFYTFSKSGTTYQYDFKKSRLYIGSNFVLMRVYYPKNTDLSFVNTLTFLGGTGEVNFSGYFNNIDNDTSMIKSSGIIILISTTEASRGYNANMVVEATKFVNYITEQKKGATNAVSGYSLGGPGAGNAAEIGNYNRLLIFDSYFNNEDKLNNVKDKEVIFYSPANDAMREKTSWTLNAIMRSNYNNVTVVTNNSTFIKNYSSKMLIINPGSSLGYSHESKIITNSNFWAYACN